jgi:Ca2+-transporting ATPase
VGRNELPRHAAPSLARRAFGHLTEPMAVLLLVAAAVAGVVLGERVDAAAIVAIVVLNAGIAVVEEGRASRALEALRTVTAPATTVRRGGRLLTVPVAEIVPGDVVLVRAGDVAPADIELTDGSVEVDESMLTGESLPVARQSSASGGPAPVLRAGTQIMRGFGVGIVRATGAATALGRIAVAVAGRSEDTPLQRELARLTTRLAAAALGIAAVVFIVSAVRSGVEDAFLAAVALAVAAVPEGLATVTILGLALGVRRMAAHGAIVRRLPAVETLGATTVIVTDKTGTLTEGRMAVEEVAVEGADPVPVGSLAPVVLCRVAEVAVGCNAATLEPPVGDVLDLALLHEFTESNVAAAVPAAVAVLPFDAGRDRMTTLHPHLEGWRVLMKGSPEAVLTRCRLERPELDHLMAVAGEMAGRGNRVIALARRDVAGPQPELDAVEDTLEFVGLVGLRDPLRREAAAAVAEARNAGVRVVMATGDHVGTANAMASAAGIDEVFARVDPDEKLALVERLCREGEVVAVTGDGVNDAPALRRADIGVAMGRGSEVARQAADMVLTDDNLATIVRAVGEGRGIYENLRRVVYYLVAGNLSEIMVVLGVLLLVPDLGVPLLPIQLLWVNLLTDGLPALALGVAPPAADLMIRRPRARGDTLLTARRLPLLAGRGAILASGPLAAVAFADRAWTASDAELRTIAFATLVLAHLLYALPLGLRGTAAAPGDRGGRLVAGTVFLAVAVQVLAMLAPPLRDLLHAEMLGPREWLVVVVAGLVPPAFIAASMPGRRRFTGPSPLSSASLDA